MLTVRRILLAQLDRAIGGLASRRFPAPAVHEARKQLKRARATLRLMRHGMGVQAYRRDNIAVRDAARPLTAVRDAKVLIETLERLDPRSPEAHSGRRHSFARQLHRALRREQREARRRLQPRDLAAAAGALRTVERRIKALTCAQLERGSLDTGLTRAYRSARKAYLRARRKPHDDLLHEWRKQTKYFSNQLEIVLPLDARFGNDQRRSKRLAECLGDDHDLALLNAKIAKYSQSSGTPHHDDTLEGLCSRLVRRRKILQRQAASLGRQLFAAAPKPMGAKIKKRLAALRRHDPQSLSAPRRRSPPSSRPFSDHM
jgi:CHAD domain-containing protein